MRSGRDADRHPTPEPIDYAAASRHEQQLGVLSDQNGRLPFDQIAPEDVVGPLLIAGNERDIRWVAEVVVATRRRHEQLIGLVGDLRALDHTLHNRGQEVPPVRSLSIFERHHVACEASGRLLPADPKAASTNADSCALGE